MYGMPVFFGPNNAKFQEAARLKECGGGIEIHGTDDFTKKMQLFEEDKSALKLAGDAAGGYVSGNSGASDKILEALGLN